MLYIMGVLKQDPKCGCSGVRHDQDYLERWRTTTSSIEFREDSRRFKGRNVPMGGESQGRKLGERGNNMYGFFQMICQSRSSRVLSKT